MTIEKNSHTKPGGFKRWINTGKKAYTRFLKIRGTPREIAAGFALGLFVGMSPTMGIQTPIAIFFAALFKWNKISAAVGVWISNPVTAPVLYGTTYFVGSHLTGVTYDFNLSNNLDFQFLYDLILQTPEILWALVVGGLITGIPVAVVGYSFSYSAVNRYQEDIKKKLAKQKELLNLRKSKLKSKRKSRRDRKKKQQ